MSMTEIAKAYVQIIPTTKGIKNSLTEELGGMADEAGAGAGEKAGSGFLGSMAKSVAKGAAVVGTAAATAVGAIAKSAASGFADYEQLTGGIETLFKSSYDQVMQYADNAYKTAGLSANAYMETVTSFSASLLQSLGGDTKQAAEAADMAIRDMSDNANKMGTSMESIQNAYQGFAKQNYTMLDNLKLGYGGTAAEMQRLLADAEKLSGVHYDISSLSDVYEAIHVVQTELGITGTTAKEASETISGSAAAMKAAWENMIVGIADDNADFDKLVDNLVDSVATYAENLIPRIEKSMEGVGELIGKLAPVIAKALPGLIESTLPVLIDSAGEVIAALAQALPELLETIHTSLIDGFKDVPGSIVDNFADSGIFEVLESVLDIIKALLPAVKLLSPAFELVGVVLKPLAAILSEVADVLSVIFGWIGKIADVAGNWLSGLFSGFNPSTMTEAVIPGNAGGTDYWRGGLTWVGENGPEIVNLPRGSQIIPAQESARMMGGSTVYNITIDAKNVREFNDIVRIAQTAQFRERMEVS